MTTDLDKTEKSASPNQPQEPEPSQDAMLRTIDVRIAEKVMGWRHDEGPTPSRPWPAESTRVWYRPGIVQPVALPHFSTDIAAAWLVVEKMRAAEWDFYLRQVAYWTADFDLDRSMLRFSADADSAPLSICRAALAAVGVA